MQNAILDSSCRATNQIFAFTQTALVSSVASVKTCCTLFCLPTVHLMHREMSRLGVRLQDANVDLVESLEACMLSYTHVCVWLPLVFQRVPRLLRASYFAQMKLRGYRRPPIDMAALLWGCSAHYIPGLAKGCPPCQSTLSNVTAPENRFLSYKLRNWWLIQYSRRASKKSGLLQTRDSHCHSNWQ